MSRQSRKTLKRYFLAGQRPTAEDFANLIDSSLNMNDEGFHKTPSEGLRVTSLGNSDALMSFYGPRPAAGGFRSASLAEWRIGFGVRKDQLAFQRPMDGAWPPPLVTLDALQTRPPHAIDSIGGRVGINLAQPQDTLDVAGVVRSTGRRGAEKPLQANGQYQTLVGDLQGCQAFEVMAGVGHRHTGRFALLHAIALNTYNPIWWDNLWFAKKRIRAQHAYYSQAADRIQLCWATPSKTPAKGHGDDATYELQIRTRRNYYADPRVDGKTVEDRMKQVPFFAYVTKLWFDDMRADPVRPEDSQT